MSGWDPLPIPKQDPAVVKAEQDGFLVVRREPNQLLLDLDDGRTINEDVLAKVIKTYGKPKVEEWTSKSGRGRHVVLSFGTGILQKSVAFTDAEATALECALGGDPERALMNVRRIQSSAADPSVLFRPTDKVPPELLGPFEVISQEQQRQVFAAGARLEPA